MLNLLSTFFNFPSNVSFFYKFFFVLTLVVTKNQEGFWPRKLFSSSLVYLQQHLSLFLVILAVFYFLVFSFSLYTWNNCIYSLIGSLCQQISYRITRTTLTALTPQMTVVLPTLTIAEPSAVVTVPMLIDTGRNSSRPRPSGLTSWPYTHTQNTFVTSHLV